MIGAQGRIVIPADVRARLNMSPGDRLQVRVEGARLVLEQPADAAAQPRSLGGSVKKRSLVAELLAERRRENR